MMRVKPQMISDVRAMEYVNTLVSQRDGVDTVDPFGEALVCGYSIIVPACPATLLGNYNVKLTRLATFERGAYRRPVVAVSTQVFSRIVQYTTPYLAAVFTYVDDHVYTQTSTPCGGSFNQVTRIYNRRYAEGVTEALWRSWFRDESQYGHIDTTGVWGPVSRIPIPESIWGVYDVLPPPAGSSAALLLDHHNKFRTT